MYYGNFKAEFFKDEAKKNPERFKQMSREDRKKKNKLLAQSFGEDTNKIVEAKKKLDNLLRRRMMVIEQLNRNLGNQGARFKTMLDAVEYVKKHLEDSDSQESQERNALNLKRLYQAMAVITSQTREEIGLISKNVINSKRTEEIEKMLLAEIETEMKLDIYDNEIRSGKAPNFVMEKNEVKKILKDPEYLFKYNK